MSTDTSDVASGWYERMRGFVASRSAPVQVTVTELGKGYVRMSQGQDGGRAEPGTDAALLAAGFACVTPLQAPCEDSSIDTAGLTDASAPLRAFTATQAERLAPSATPARRIGPAARSR